MVRILENRQETKTLRAIGLNVRTARERRGWSQEHLAELASVHDRTIGKIERGELNFSVLILLKLGKALDCSPNSLLNM
jgi:transcriptional regulator with XRE-family HTH domain